MNDSHLINDRDFTKATLLAGGTLASGSFRMLAAGDPKRIRVGLIGCGSMPGQYLPQLKQCSYAEVVSLCDRKCERAQRRGKEFGVANTYPNIDAMLAGVPFDFLVDTTDMQEHEGINRKGLEAGKHVWSEKPIANTLAAGHPSAWTSRRRIRRRWSATSLNRRVTSGNEVLATGKENLLVTPEQALHVLEIITAARESSATGKRIALTSTFKWLIIS